MLTFIRSTLFNILLVVWTLFIPIIMLPTLLLSRNIAYKVAYLWSAGFIWGLKTICNIRIEIKGLENLPKTPFILVSKHQSMIETILFQKLFYNPAFILKKELLRIPIFGWYLPALGAIYIDRSLGMGAIKKITRDMKEVVENQRVIIIFPEGTRVRPEQEVKYRPGIAAIHNAYPEVPIVPVALNTGLFWPKGQWVRNPGTVKVEFLKPLGEKMSKNQLTHELKILIDTKSKELCNIS